MRIFFACLLIVLFISCKKDKYTTAPQITYKSISQSVFTQSNNAVPKLTFGITDAEGDIGLKSRSDTAWIYIKNLFTGAFDSIPFPDIQSSGTKSFKADVDVVLTLNHTCNPPDMVTDTLFYEVYVRDFAKNKSNVITTPDPVYYRCF